MAGPDQITFADIDGISGNPTIDGWTGNEDPGVITSEIDAGYAPGDRVTFQGGSAFPPVVFQGIRVVNPPTPVGTPGGTYLALAFFCSFDVSFDDGDVVVVGLRKAGSVDPADTRRLDLFPVRDGIGAGTALDPYVTLNGTPGGSNFYVRTDRTLLATTIWKGRAPTMGDTRLWEPAAPANIQARAASWRPGVTGATTTTDTNVPAGTTPFAINVDDVSGLPPTGAIVLDPGGANLTISYTGKTLTAAPAGQLTGCKNRSGSGTIVAAGSEVKVAAVGWSIELLLPTAVGADWIPLDDNFGIYFDIVRLSPYDAGGSQGLSGYFATQYVFPVGLPPLTGTLGDHTAIPSYGTARIGAVAKGVGFQNQASPASSVGARDRLAAANSALVGTIEGPTGTYDNRLVAQLVNTDTTTAANNVTAEFRFANWGLPPATFPAWAPANGAQAPVAVNLPANGGTGEVTVDWLKANVPTDYTVHPHQCMWVRLNSTNAVHFSQAGTRRNMDLQNLSEHEEDIEISGVGYGSPADGVGHEFLLVPSVREIVVPDVGESRIVLAEIQQFRKILVWTVDGFRRTADTITIGKITAEILDPTPGQFGVVAMHDDPQDVLGYQIRGDGIRWTTGGFLSVRVPPEGSVRGRVRLNAAPKEVIATEDDQYIRELPPVPVEPMKPPSNTPPPTTDLGGCWKRLLHMLGIGALTLGVIVRLHR